MELFEYIKSQLPQMPNVAIMKDLGANDELVEYVKESPENTNLGMMETLGCKNNNNGEIWYAGKGLGCENSLIVAYLIPTEKANTTILITNPDDYIVTINNIICPYIFQDGGEYTGYVAFANNNDDHLATHYISIGYNIDENTSERIPNDQGMLIAFGECPEDQSQITNTPYEVIVTKK